MFEPPKPVRARYRSQVIVAAMTRSHAAAVAFNPKNSVWTRLKATTERRGVWRPPIAKPRNGTLILALRAFNIIKYDELRLKPAAEMNKKIKLRFQRCTCQILLMQEGSI